MNFNVVLNYVFIISKNDKEFLGYLYIKDNVVLS